MGYDFYYYVLIAVLVIYLGLRLLVNRARQSPAGDPRGPDQNRTSRLRHPCQTAVAFVLAAVLAGISGLFYVQWGNYITPSQVGLLQASLPVVWVAVGGRESLLAVLMSTVALNRLTLHAVVGAANQYALIITGGFWLSS